MSNGLSLVGQWNEVMLDAIRSTGASPTPTTYHLHLVSSAIYDAWAAYDDDAYGYYTDLVRPTSEHTDANKEMAISFAAHRMLSELFPTQTAAFNAFLSQLGYDAVIALADPSNPAYLGQLAFQGVLDARENDGSNRANGYADTSGYQPVNDPQEGSAGAPGGQDFDPNHWQPLRVPTGTLLDNNGNPTFDDNDPSTFNDQVALTPHWGSVTAFALETGSQVRPDAPPQLGDFSAYTDSLGNVTTNDQAYRDQFTAVAQASATLTNEEKVIAEYWADGPRTESPPGHWNQIAQDISLREGHGIDDDAKMFFALNAALLDAGIATWEAKYAYDFVRPQSAIRDLFFGVEIDAWAGPDLGTQTILGQTWQPYQDTTFVTPPFPEYTSGHSSFSMAAANTIAAYVGSDAFYDGTTLSNYDLDDVAGTDLLGQYVATSLNFETFSGDPVTLQWATLTEAAEEAGISRIFGGIHIQDGDFNGRQIGRDVATLGQVQWDALFTRGGNDAIQGTGDSEMLIAGTGNDTVDAGAGNDTILGGTGDDTLTGGAGEDAFAGTLDELLGDVITDFDGDDDTIVFEDSALARSDITVRDGSAILGVDIDNSGTVEADEEIALEGDFSGGDFMAVTGGGDTTVTFETFLPTLSEAQQVDAALINGIINDAFFRGDGSTDFRITLASQAEAAFKNSLGAYEVDSDGNILNVDLLFADTSLGGSAVLSDVTAGHQLGFFIVQNGADWASSLSGNDSLDFLTTAGGSANANASEALLLALNGADAGQTAFHSIAAALNIDGIQHALSGVDVGGTSVSVGFEDLTGGGDQDYQDVVFQVEAADTFIM